MKKLGMLLMLLMAMTMGSHRVFAQSVTITLMPGWNWISCPMMDTLDFETAMGSVTPVAGDIIKSRWGSATYTGEQWRGTISQFYPGYGYHYMSNRTMPVFLTFNAQQPTPQVIVTTMEPTDITAVSAISGGSLSSTDGSYIVVLEKGICWATHPNPTVMNDFHIENGSGINNFTAEMTDLNTNTVYYIRAYAVTIDGTTYGDELSFTTLDYGYVDLGLPSGTLWATCNVGANAPEEYGDYFAWGETQPKDTYSWLSYMFAEGTSWNAPRLTKYCNNSNYGNNGFTDNLTTLLPEDDAATVNWGNGWRMPTKEEWWELYNNTTCTWTIQNGVSGSLYTATNGNSLFLPAAGCCEEGNLYYTESDGRYWSSSLDTADYHPWAASGWYIYSEACSYFEGCRAYGKSVRAVRSSSNEMGSLTVTTFPSADISYIADVEPCPGLTVTVSLLYEGVSVDADTIPEGWTHVATGVYQRSLNQPGTVDEQVWLYTINGISGPQTITENSAARSLTADYPAYWGIYPSNDTSGDITDIVASLAQQNRLTTDLPETTLEIPNPTDSTCWLWIVTKGTATAKTAIFDLNVMCDPVEGKQFASPMPDANWELDGYKAYVSQHSAAANASFGNVKLTIDL